MITGMLVPAVVSAAVAALAVRGPTPGLYGLELVHNSPAEPGLVTVDAKTGKMKLLGTGQSAESCTGELGAVDQKRGVYYYLGDSVKGATLVGLSLKDGSLLCSKPVPELREIQFVGIGQSLNYDSLSDSLVLSGISSAKNASGGLGHAILRHDLSKPTSCGPFEPAGFYGDGDSAPMLHGSALDVAGQRLFVTLSAGQGLVAIGIIDLAHAGNMSSVVVEGTPAADSMVGMAWDSVSQRLVSLSQGPGETGINLVSLDPLTGVWSVSNVGGDYPVLGGNDGEVMAYDDASGVMSSYAAAPPSGNGDPVYHLLQVDVRKAKIIGTSPLLGTVGLGLLMQLVAVS